MTDTRIAACAAAVFFMLGGILMDLHFRASAAGALICAIGTTLWMIDAD